MFSVVFKGAPLGNKNAAGKHKAGGLKSHPNYTESDHKYLKGKGYSDDEIKAIWDRDKATGNAGLVHGKTPLQAELDKKGTVGWAVGITSKYPAKKGEVMFANVLKSNPEGINQYTKNGGKGSDPDDELVSVGDSWNGGNGQPEKTHSIPKSPAGAVSQHDMDKVSQDYAALKKLPTADLLKKHKALRKVQGPYTAAEVGGKQGLIDDILRASHGTKRLDAFYAQPKKSKKAEEAFSGYPCDMGLVQKANPQGINQWSKGSGASSAQSKAYLEGKLSAVRAKMGAGTSSRMVMAGWKRKEQEYANALANFKK